MIWAIAHNIISVALLFLCYPAYLKLVHLPLNCLWVLWCTVALVQPTTNLWVSSQCVQNIVLQGLHCSLFIRLLWGGLFWWDSGLRSARRKAELGGHTVILVLIFILILHLTPKQIPHTVAIGNEMCFWFLKGEKHSGCGVLLCRGESGLEVLGAKIMSWCNDSSARWWYILLRRGPQSRTDPRNRFVCVCACVCFLCVLCFHVSESEWRKRVNKSDVWVWITRPPAYQCHPPSRISVMLLDRMLGRRRVFLCLFCCCLSRQRWRWLERMLPAERASASHW